MTRITKDKKGVHREKKGMCVRMWARGSALGLSRTGKKKRPSANFGWLV